MIHSYIRGINLYNIHTTKKDDKPLEVVYVPTYIDTMEARFCLECTKKKCNGYCKTFKMFSSKIRKNIKQKPKDENEYFDLYYKYVDEVLNG